MFTHYHTLELFEGTYVYMGTLLVKIHLVNKAYSLIDFIP